MRFPESHTRFSLVLLVVGILSGCSGSDAIRLIDETATGGEATQLVMESATSPGLAGRCNAIRVSFKDANGIETVASSAQSTSINLSSDMGLFYDGPACLTAITSASVDPGSKFVWVYFKHATAGTSPNLSVSATLASPVSASLSLSLVASAATTLQFQSAPTTLVSGACSGPVRVALTDAGGNTTSATTQVTVALASDAGAKVYSDSSCTSLVTSTVIDSGSSLSGQFYLKDLAAGTNILSATNSLFTAGSAVFFSAPLAGGATKLAMSGYPSVDVGSCSLGVVLYSQDASGNIASLSETSATTVSLSTGGIGTFFSDAACTNAVSSVTFGAGEVSARLYLRSTLGGSTLLSASSGSAIRPAVYPFTFRPTNPVKLVWLGSSSLSLGGCGTYWIQTQNAAGEIAVTSSAVSVTLGGRGQGAFYGDSTCTGSAITSISLAANTSLVPVFFRNRTLEELVLISTATGLSGGTLPVSMTLGTGRKWVFSGLPAGLNVATNACVGPYTVVAQDSSGAQVNIDAAATLTLAASNSGVFYNNDAACGAGNAITSVSVASGASSTGNLYYKKTTAGQSVWTATDTASSAFLANAMVVMTVGGLSPVRVALSGSAQTSVGTCTAYTVTAQDNNGSASNVSSATSVTLTGAGSGAFYSTSAECDASTPAVTSVSIASGSNNRVFYYKNTRSEAVTLGVTALSYSSSLAVAVAAPVASGIRLSGPKQLSAGSCSAPFTLSLRDSLGSVASDGSSRTFGLSLVRLDQLSAVTASFFTDAACTSPVSVAGQVTFGASGGSQTLYVLTPTSGMLRLSATDQSSALGSASIEVLSDVAADGISNWGGHTCATVSGAVWCWGGNGSGQLGNRTTVSNSFPVPVDGLSSGVTKVMVGSNHSCALLSTGGVKCWGANGSGQLGDATTTARTAPVDVLQPTGTSALAGIIDLSVRGDTTCAVNSSGTVYCWGLNSSAQFGNGTFLNSSRPQVLVGLNATPTQVAVGASHICVLASGGVQCMGANGGRLGNGATAIAMSPVTAIATGSGVVSIGAGFDHTCALFSDQRMKCWGVNSSGQLGDSTTTTRTVPTDVWDLGVGSGITSLSVGYATTCVIRGASLWCWGESDNYRNGVQFGADLRVPTFVSALPGKVSAVSSGGSSAGCAIMDGAPYCWGGSNSLSAELGRGTLLYSHRASAVVGIGTGSTQAIAGGGSVFCALDANQSLYCWGTPGNSSMGAVGTTSTAALVFSSTAATQLVHGQEFGCFLIGGGLQCWGRGSNGTFGNANNVNFATLQSIPGFTTGVTHVAVSLGAQRVCAVKDGAASCWGNNGFGALGDGTNVDRYQPVSVSGLSSGVTALSLGSTHSCALANGGVMCWGYNNRGQLGNATTADSWTPVQVQGLSSGVSSIASTSSTNCAILSSGAVQCWGDNTSGQLGDGSKTNRSVPVQVQGWGAGSGVTAVSVGTNSACGIQNGALYCWGSNSRGQLGYPLSFTQSLRPVLHPDFLTGVTAVTVGDTVACAIQNGQTYCWGDNGSWRLGHRDSTTFQQLPMPVVPIQGL